MKIAAAGDRALLVELADVSARELHAAARSAKALPGVIACIPGHSSVYVVFSSEPDPDALEAAITRGANEQRTTNNEQRSITVSFASEYAPDLLEFLDRAHILREEFLSRIGHLRFIARYLGFRAGFAYLDGWPQEWAMPRRATSRPVSRGSFGIAGAVAGFYPIDTPGGWNILGRTDADLAIEPGDEITIEPTLAKISPSPLRQKTPLIIPGVELSGPLAIVVGSPDWSRVNRGEAPGGPFDPEAAALANRAIGNAPDAPVIECAMVVPKISVPRDRIAAWVGPDGTVSHALPAGKIAGGLRGYIAIVAPASGRPFRRRPAGGIGARETRAERPAGGRRYILALAGPHDIGLREVECEVTTQLDRVGIRLRPLQPIETTPPADLPSCGMQCGTVQLHPDGSLMVMGPDHPVTGGYLQPMTVISSERWKLAQLSPGERIPPIVQPP